MNPSNLLICLMTLSLFLAAASEAQGQPKAVKFTNEWKGSVPDGKITKATPDCITSAKSLEMLWKEWKIADKMPTVDFTKEIVVIGTTSGSLLNLSARLDDNGNLEVLGMGTLDFLPGFRYVLATVSREGVKTVNKKALSQEK